MVNTEDWTLLGWTDAYYLLSNYFKKAGVSLKLISTQDFINQKKLIPDNNIIIASTFKRFPNRIKKDLIDNFCMALESKLSYLPNPNVIFISSAAVYGLTKSKVSFLEDSIINPLNEYSEEKVLLETLLGKICTNNNSRCLILRSSGLFGKYEFFGNSNNLIDQLYKSLIYNQELKLDIEYGGLQRRDFIHIDDLLEIICYFSCNIKKFSKEHSPHIFNISNNKKYTISKIISIAQLYNNKIKIKINNTSIKHIHCTLDNSKLRNSLGIKKFRQVEEYLKIKK